MMEIIGNDDKTLGSGNSPRSAPDYQDPLPPGIGHGRVALSDATD